MLLGPAVCNSTSSRNHHTGQTRKPRRERLCSNFARGRPHRNGPGSSGGPGLSAMSTSFSMSAGSFTKLRKKADAEGRNRKKAVAENPRVLFESEDQFEAAGTNRGEDSRRETQLFVVAKGQIPAALDAELRRGFNDAELYAGSSAHHSLRFIQSPLISPFPCPLPSQRAHRPPRAPHACTLGAHPAHCALALWPFCRGQVVHPRRQCV